MPRDGAIIFSDLIGKLDVLRVACEKCGRNGRYILAKSTTLPQLSQLITSRAML